MTITMKRDALVEHLTKQLKAAQAEDEGLRRRELSVCSRK